MIAAALLVAGAFLCGSIPFGVLFARARGVDLREVGSGNIGATNAARALGKKIGLVVLLCDAAKGLGPVLLARHFQSALLGGEVTVAACGGAAFLGHLYTPWLRFRGGKGVATALGVFLAISPLAALAAVLIFAIVYAAFRVASLGSLAGATVFLPALWELGAPEPYLVLAAFMWLLIVWKHRGNIGRLARREESKV